MITWKIDPAHSDIGFKIKHLMISNVKGHFTSFDASIAMEDKDFSKATIAFTAETASINTKNEARDGHLQSAEFFDSSKFPTISFKSTSIVKNDDKNFVVTGELDMHGVKKEISLDTTFNGTTIDMYGNDVMSFAISGSLSREAFGIVWNSPLATGGLALSDEVKLDIDAEFKEVK